MGAITHDDGVEVFYSQTHQKLKKAFLKAIVRVKQEAEIMIQVRRQVVPLMEVIQSGEARLSIDVNKSDQYVGAMIKSILRYSDGASFQVQESLEQLNSRNLGKGEGL